MFQKMNNEKGIALIAALMVLMVLTLLGISAILTSTTDMQIANNEKNAIQGQYAAEAGIEEALVRLNATGANAISEPSPAPVWGDDFSGVLAAWQPTITQVIMDGAKTFSSYSTIVSYKSYVESGTEKVAFYNQASGYAAPAPATGGWPVYVITSVASTGNYQTPKTILELTKTTFTYKAKGGLTAGGGIGMSGNVEVDGKFYDENGAILDPQPLGSDPACKDATLAQPKPGVFANGATTTGGSSSTTGGTGQLGAVVSADVPTSPWDAMGLNYDSSTITTPPDTGYYFTTLFPTTTYPTTYTGGAPIGNQYYSSSASALTGNGNGLLIIHNPLFIPGACADGIFDGIPAACAAANAPAILTKGGGNATFRGLIIADMVNLQGGGTVQITGGLISLTTINTTGWTGTANINFSCQAIEKFAGGKINNKLNWRKE